MPLHGSVSDKPGILTAMEAILQFTKVQMPEIHGRRFRKTADFLLETV